MEQIIKYRRKPNNPIEFFDEGYPENIETYRAGYHSVIRMLKSASKHKYGLDQNHHESQIHLGSRYLFHHPSDMFSKTTIHYQSLPFYSIILFINPKQTVLDDAMKSYSPEK